jgi:uncharacterized protein YcbK (DUF882 family)
MISEEIRETWRIRWPHFSPAEIPSALDFLEFFRAHLKHPIVVNSDVLRYRGYRSCSENLRVGGKSHSKHIMGVAFDISVDGMSVDQVFTEAIKFGWHGIGKYQSKGFVHVDVRPRLGSGQVLWEQ